MLERIDTRVEHGVELCGSGGILVPSRCKFGDGSLGLLKTKKCLTVGHFRFSQRCY